MMFHFISLYTRPLDEIQSYYNLYLYHFYKLLFERRLADAIDAGNTFEFRNTEK